MNKAITLNMVLIVSMLALTSCYFVFFEKKQSKDIKVALHKTIKDSLFIFIHGTGGTEQQMEHYHKPGFDIMCGTENRAFNLPIADKVSMVPSIKGNIEKLGGNWTVRCNPLKMSFAQEYELERMNEMCANITQPIVFIGMSLGATSVLNYAGVYKNKHIKALVVEAPFDHISSVVHRVISPKWLSKDKVNSVLQTLTRGKFKVDGPHAEDSVQHIEKSVPILLIHSKADHLIPLSSSEHLYKELRRSGHNHAYLLVLDKGEHGLYQNEYYGSPEIYQATVHAFYKKYHLPHDEVLAQEGEQYFAQCQPAYE